MKIRVGFVSNSSSSSFCILGFDMDMGDMIENIKKAIKGKGLGALNLKDLLKSKYPGEEDGIDWDAVNDNLQEFIEEEGELQFLTDEGGYAAVGNEWCTIRDDQTGLEFKEAVLASLKKYGIAKANATVGDLETVNKEIQT
jgi:hypothetical protein